MTNRPKNRSDSGQYLWIPSNENVVSDGLVLTIVFPYADARSRFQILQARSAYEVVVMSYTQVRLTEAQLSDTLLHEEYSRREPCIIRRIYT